MIQKDIIPKDFFAEGSEGALLYGRSYDLPELQLIKR